MVVPGPSLEEQLWALSPKARIVGGVLLIAFGAGGAVAFWGMGLIWFGSMTCVLLGIAAIGNGVHERKRARAVQAEVDRARAEWEDLERELALVRRTKGNAARMLQDRGYREFHVRRWIVAALDQEGA